MLGLAPRPTSLVPLVSRKPGKQKTPRTGRPKHTRLLRGSLCSRRSTALSFLLTEGDREPRRGGLYLYTTGTSSLASNQPAHHDVPGKTWDLSSHQSSLGLWEGKVHQGAAFRFLLFGMSPEQSRVVKKPWMRKNSVTKTVRHNDLAGPLHKRIPRQLPVTYHNKTRVPDSLRQTER